MPSYSQQFLSVLLTDVLINIDIVQKLSQISYLLVVMLELNGVSEVQYKEIIIIGNE